MLRNIISKLTCTEQEFVIEKNVKVLAADLIVKQQLKILVMQKIIKK